MTIEDLIWGRKLGIKRSDLATGNPEFVKLALKELGVDIPCPPDYPDCLKDFLFRKIWQTNLADLEKSFEENPNLEIFVKPANSAKAFDGMVLKG